MRWVLTSVLLSLLSFVPHLPAATAPAEKPSSTASLTLGGGCFWCVEAVFETVSGVRSVISGYAGGAHPRPTYKEVCDGTTGHAEVVQIRFDPAAVSVEELLDLFWEAHDPTTLNRQGADVGSQYRSIILFMDDDQRAKAEASRTAAQARMGKSIATEIVPLTTFHPAEAYHQDYFRNNPDARYCVYVIRPKLKKLGR